mgnify:CR=1 FL=1
MGLGVLLGMGAPLLGQSTNGVLREVFTGIGGGAVSDLTNSTIFPCCPSIESIQPSFEAPSDFADNYGTRMRALVVPPTTGAYTFWIASDDNSVLYLSTTDNPAQRSPIAWVNGWTSSREWTREANQKSAAILLSAGKQYYLEALQKEGAGGDNLAVRWQLPGGSIEEPIPGNRLLVYGLGPPLISTQPSSASVVESGGATFAVVLQRMLGASFQWFRDGASLPGATNATLQLLNLTLADSGSQFFCGITNSLGSTNSVTVTLTVRPDITPPVVSTVGSSGEPTTAFVVFSEPVEAASATNRLNYSINNGITVVRAQFGSDTRTILLATTPMAPGGTNTLSISGVRDRATTPNQMSPAVRSFVVGGRPLEISLLSLPKEPLGPSTRRHGVVISEVMYHPTNRLDGRNLEYLEIYNSQPWFEEIGGWRISGAVDYTFPSNLVLNPRSFLVVAASPDDFRLAYPFTNVFGPFDGGGSLQNSAGTLRLRNAQGAVLFEMSYTGNPPYPPAADGAGHSLVLGRPSYGEGDPRAWVASERIGGTPGAPESAPLLPERTVVINEILAHTDAPTLDFVELYNYGNGDVNLGGCVLTDDPSTNTFVIPPGTVIHPRGFLSFDEVQLGFSLSSAGETLYFKNAAGTAVIDSLRFPEQENGVALGRFPDGAPAFSRLATPTPGTNNAPVRGGDVVINEVMFDPLSGVSGDQYVELFNRGTNRVDLSDWRLRGGVSFKFPAGSLIDPAGYLVVAADVARLRSNYANLTLVNSVGNFSGSLGHGGDHLELQKPDLAVGTNSAGLLRTNILHVIVDELTYGAAGRWGVWAFGGGSSLELRDPKADRRFPSSWGDSDESSKSPWVTIQATGVMDNGWADAYQLHVTLLGAGEVMLDDVQVIPAGSTNLILNGTFDAGAAGWVFQGNHNGSSWEPAEGATGPGCLHIRATGRGDSGANRIRTQLPRTLAAGQTVTLRARARWLRGNPNLLLRLRGNWMEASGSTILLGNPGTPGGRNSRATGNIGPAITDVRHWPAAPAASQGVLVTARASDPDGLALLTLNYRIDPSTNYTAVALTNNGAGWFSASIPGQVAGATAAFFIRGLDNALPPAAATFPASAPLRECVVRWGDSTLPGTLGTYRIWLTQTNLARWVGEEKMSNNAKDVTFLYGTNRVIYNAGAWFHGSPYHSPGYDSPIGASCDYDMGFPADDPLLGETDINLFRPGNGGGDGTAQAEIHGYWFGHQLGIPFLYCRPVFVFVNGQRRETVFLDAQQPNGDFVRQWFPGDSSGDLHKVQLGFEFGDLAYGASEPGYAVVGASLSRVQTTGGAYKAGWYRATLPLRSAAVQEFNDYTNIYRLVETAQTNLAVGTDRYTVAQTNAVDVSEWYKVDVAQHLYNNGDSFSYGGGQNAFLYKPVHDTWKLFLWDIDFAFGGDPLDPNLTGIGGAEHGPMNSHPAFGRIYWQTLLEAANGFLTPDRSDPILASRYNGLVAAGAAVGDPAGIRSFIAARRGYVLSQLATLNTPFAVSSTKGLDFSTNRNLITVSGVAPLEVRTLLINGIALPVSWTTLTNWTVRIPLRAGVNALAIAGVDVHGASVPAASATMHITFTGVEELPQEKIVINEIHYNPLLAGTGFIELLNRSTTSAFDLSGWRLSGAGFVFPPGTTLEPNTYIVVVQDLGAFSVAFGPMSAVVGEYGGNLKPGGETITLIKPGATPELDQVIDQVTYDSAPPWPAAANGLGASLQLVDPSQDNNRVANWATATGTQKKATPGASNSVRVTLTPIPPLWLNELCPTNPVVGARPPRLDVAGQADPWLELYNGGTNTVSLSGYYLANQPGNLVQWPFPPGAAISPGGFLLVWVDGDASQSAAGELHTSFRVDPVAGTVLLTRGPATNNIIDYLSYRTPVAGRSYGSFPDGAVSGRRLFPVMTPGAPNDPAYPPLDVRINEWMADNATTLVDPADGQYQDWFELWNPADELADLSGCTLTDNAANPGQFKVPLGTVIPPHGFLLVWADGHPSQNGVDVPDLHVNFSLAKGGEIIALYGPDGGVIDAVGFGPQTADISQGRYPDGAPDIRSFTNATPRAANLLRLPNTPPLLAQPPDRVVDEGVLLSFAAVAVDTDLPSQGLAYSLDAGAPEGASIDPHTGVFRWIPSESQGPGVYTLTLRVTDDGLPPLSDARLFKVTVNEANSPPSLAPILSLSVPEGQTLWVTNSATDPDPIQQTLRFSLDPGAPEGAAIDPVSGLLSWTPSEAQGPGNYTITVRVTDNGVPPLSDAKSFTVSVSEVNQPPLLIPIADRQVWVGVPVDFLVQASDPDLPRQGLVYLMQGASAASIDPSTGRFSWTPGDADAFTTNRFTVQVHDDGSPPLFATASFSLWVVPLLQILSAELSPGGVEIRWSSTPGKVYRLEYRTALEAGGWIDQGIAIESVGPSTAVRLPIEPTENRVYRVVLPE